MGKPVPLGFERGLDLRKRRGVHATSSSGRWFGVGWKPSA